MSLALVCAGLGLAPLAQAGDWEVSPEPASEAEPLEADESADAAAEGSFSGAVKLADRGSITGQWFWLKGKAMPGVELGMGHGLFEGNLELSFISLTESSRDFDKSFVGNHLGLYLMMTPLRARSADISFGLGGDFYLLWGIHSGAKEAALVPRVVTRFWLGDSLALSFSARTYLLHGDGLALGTARDGGSGSPILLSTGITWGFH